MATDSKIGDETIDAVTSDFKEAKVLSNGKNDTNNCDPETKPVSENQSIEQPSEIAEAEKQPSKNIKPINEEVYNYLKDLLENNLNKETETIPSDIQLNIALQFLYTGESCEENLSHCLNNLINCLIEAAPHFIKFPDPEEAISVQQYFYDLGARKYKTGFPNILGVIDCTHVFLQTPLERPEIYLNRQCNYSINVQIVCGPDLQIYNVLAAFPGGMDDACIWQCSNLRQVISKSDLNTRYLIGDSNYPQEPWMMTPLSKINTRAEKLYNKLHTRIWTAIKKCIELLRSRFGCLNSILNCEPKKVCAIITACCVLHNICLQFGDVIMEIDSNLNETQNVDFKQTITVDSMEEGVTARNDLIKNCFSI